MQGDSISPCISKRALRFSTTGDYMKLNRMLVVRGRDNQDYAHNYEVTVPDTLEQAIRDIGEYRILQIVTRELEREARQNERMNFIESMKRSFKEML